MAIQEAYYSFLSTIFAPLLALHPAIGEGILAISIVFVITLFYKYLVKQDDMKDIRDQIKAKQKEAKEVQKTNPEQAQKMTSEILALTNKQMKMTFKPMLVSMMFVILLFPWLKLAFVGPIVYLPVEILGRASFGWFLWYIVISMPFSMAFRKLLGVM
ncbi:MAG: DUF106 domain-containing protein [Nanoarchaeota archaeon]|nr:DUF106 domain-containing protein [Nanoarchaeota archaeon]